MFESKVGLRILTIFLAMTSLASASTDGVPDAPKPPVQKSNAWLEHEVPISLDRIFKNVSPHDARPGAVVAAQTRDNPNYYFHWVRDAALTMEALIAQYNFNVKHQRTATREQQIIRHKLMEYFEFSLFIQNVPTLEGLGEPKFNVDGSAYNEPWGRPQNDGPALRALSLIHFAKILIDEGHFELVRSRFYNPKHANGSVIKKDLEFVSHRWRQSSFDLWEEVRGDHFYTRMVQRRALIEGAELASTLGDAAAAQWYGTQAKEIERDLHQFWSEAHGYFITTRNRVEGLDYKQSQLDTAFVLGLLHGSVGDGFLPFSDPKVIATFNHIAMSFARIYPINHNTASMGLAIGRYPEDKYGGSHFNHGNPWVLTTLAFAEAFYRAAAEAESNHETLKAQDWVVKGDSFVRRVQYHTHADGSLNEQFDRHNGYMTSVEDLTWNYAAVLTTYQARQLAHSNKVTSY